MNLPPPPQVVKKIDAAHSDGVWAAAWSQGDIVTGSVDGSVKLWDFQPNDEGNRELSCKFTSKPSKAGVVSIAAVQDGSTAAVSYQDSTIRLFDLIERKESALIQPGFSEAWAVCLSPGDDVLASGNSRGAINIWSMQEGHERVASFETNNKFIMSTCFSIDGKLASGGVDGVVNVFDMSTQSVVQKIEAHAMPIRTIAFSPDGDLLYSVSEDRHAHVYDMRSGSLIKGFSHPNMVLSVSASPDERHFVTGCGDASVYYWDLGLQRLERSMRTHRDMVWGVACNPSDTSGRQFVSVGDDGALRIYE